MSVAQGNGHGEVALEVRGRRAGSVYAIVALITAAMTSLIIAWVSYAAAADTTEIVDSNLAVGRHTSLALDASGNPVISYFDDVATEVKLAKCDDPACAGGNESLSTVEALDRKVLQTSLALAAADEPVIAYIEDGSDSPLFQTRPRVLVTRCNDAACVGGNESTTVVDSSVGSGLALQVDGTGNPILAYTDLSSTGGFNPLLVPRRVVVVQCNDPACVGGDESVSTPVSVPVLGGDTIKVLSMVLDASNNPVIAFSEGTQLRLLRCNDPACGGNNESITTIDGSLEFGPPASLRLDPAGNPVVAYWDLPDGNLKLARCNDAFCGGNNESIQTVTNVGFNFDDPYVSLQLDASANPVIAYLDTLNFDLELVRCDDPNCAGSGELFVTLDSSAAVGRYLSLQLGPGDVPVASYYDLAASNLKVARCDTACFPVLECAGAAVTVDLNTGESPTNGDDVILGTPGPDVINALGGNDIVCGEGGDDTISGFTGDDVIYGADGNDTIYGADGNDTIRGGDGDDTIVGQAGNDDLDGGAGDDTISGGLGDDTVNGGGALAGAGDELLYGGPGNDTITGSFLTNTVLGGDGNDVIETVSFGSNLISGNDGDDEIIGGGAADTIYGVGGDDIILGDGGNDVVLGGPGDDLIYGELGDDQISGNEDDDEIRGDEGADQLYGTDGDDLLRGGDGADIILGGAGADDIRGENGDDLLSGNDGNDTVTGGPGTDEVYGANGNDTLTGGSGTDIIIGGNNNDTIDAADGAYDDVSGNAGTDTCTRDLFDNVFLCEVLLP